jgi:hypothetical protein
MSAQNAPPLNALLGRRGRRGHLHRGGGELHPEAVPRYEPRLPTGPRPPVTNDKHMSQLSTLVLSNRLVDH